MHIRAITILASIAALLWHVLRYAGSGIIILVMGLCLRAKDRAEELARGVTRQNVWGFSGFALAFLVLILAGGV